MHAETRASPQTMAAFGRRFWPYLLKLRWWLVLAVLLVLVAPLIRGGLLWLLQILVDDVLVGGRLGLLPGLLAGYVVGAAVKFATEYVDRRVDATISERVIQDVRVDVYRHVATVSPGSLGGRSPGDLLALLSGDAERIQSLVHAEPLGLVADVASVVFFTTFLWILSWKLTLVALAVVPALTWVMVRQAPRVKRAARVARRRGVTWLALAEEVLPALPLIHAFQTQAHESARFEGKCDLARQAELRAVALQAWFTLLVEVIATAGGLLVLAAAAYEIQSGAMTVGRVVVFLGSIGSLYDPIRGLAKATARLQRAAVGAQRVARLLDTPSAVQERRGARSLDRVEGRIEFRHVSFGYPHGEEAARDVCLTIEPGETVAVVGPSGGGKSTLVHLLVRLYDPDDGAVLVDGIDIRDVTLASLRSSIAVVFQDLFVMQGSIADNIRYGRPDASDPSVRLAARAAHVEPFVERSRRGYGALVGPEGRRLSGGQRQRIALARALLKDAPILVLDEATASVDGETEELIQDALARLAGRRTIVVVGHRLSTVRRADRVVVVEQGRIVEVGVIDTLLRNGSRCHDLFAAQLGAHATGV
jgi:ATP-binding cassette, subfamily B, bacterial